jgi:hypothetical protein
LAEGCFATLRFTVTRITDYAMRAGEAGPRVVKDWRRFWTRFEMLEGMGNDGVLRVMGMGRGEGARGAGAKRVRKVRGAKGGG